MKKLRIFLILCLALAMLAGCGGNQDPTEPSTEPPTEAATNPPTDPPTEPSTEPPTEPSVPVVGYHFTEPEGFIPVSATESLSILSSPDGDGTNISIVVMPMALTYDDLDEEAFLTGLGITGDNGQPAELELLEKTTVDGYPALIAKFSMTTSGIDVNSTAYFVSAGNSTFIFIYSDATADGSWSDEFEASAATINILLEGEFLPVDTANLEQYDLDCGLMISAAPGLKKMDVEGFTACLTNEEVMILILEERKDDYGLYGLTLEDYAALYEEYGIITGFSYDLYGNLAATFTSEVDGGVEYFYYATVKNTGDSFWLIQMACLSDMAPSYVESFTQWGATIAEIR